MAINTYPPPNRLSGVGSPAGLGAPIGSEYVQIDANSTHGNLAGIRWLKVGAGTVLNTDWVPDFQGRWAIWSPTWFSDGTQPSLGNGTSEWFYQITAKTLEIQGRIFWGSTTNGGTGAWSFSLPPGVSAVYGERYPNPASAWDSNVGLYSGWLACETYGTDRFAVLYSIGANWASINQGIPFTWAVNDRLYVNAKFRIV